MRPDLFTLATLALAGTAHAQTGAPVPQGEPNVDATPAFEEQTRAPAVESDVTLERTELADGLVHPWGLAALPEGGFLVTERPGRLRHVAADGTVSEPVAGVPEVLAQRQGGLLDVAIAADFAESRTVYLTYAKPLGDGLSATAAAKGTLSEDMGELSDVTDIWVQEPGSPSPMHYGSRILIDDEVAWITTGEHFTEAERVYAQDLDKTYGKVIRVGLDGEVPEDNPFVGEEGAIDAIWSLGHRNIQGAALHPETGALWVIEHGPAGGDELNIAGAGENFGWPVVSYGENYDGTPVGSGEHSHAENGFVEPRYYWDPVIAPGGMIFYRGEMFPEWQGDILASGLVSKSLVRLTLDGDTVTGEERLIEEIGRVRDVETAGDGALVVLIDAEDGRMVRVERAAATD